MYVGLCSVLHNLQCNLIPDENEANAIDVDKYTMKRVSLSNIVENPSDDYVSKSWR